MEIFVDSSALFVWGDRTSEEGREIESFLRAERPHLVTTNLILAETLSLITKRIGKVRGSEVGEIIFASNIIRLVFMEESIQRESWQMYKKYKDKDFDFIDATSFVFCQKHGIKEAVTLDRHFSQMGFKVYP